ncbi:ATP-binding cassette subfamily F protein uup [Salsuginibacillus halophilus]|uniref:ATP-binding cassette subfamily F protein uup n=1 Tax=Salsuginibacillus halophilus TaxID=517424 RepID=A0A2P8HBC3_9BACI|nr:ABC-F family ATP-binding cassette domain-containing protein [Salsuginibacillus halophilus]PSL43526.1 ATP-binding cassette subfamily F protein uup [Salsuginibacillus halophilus]
MSILVAEGLTKTHGDKTLFQNISFTIEPKQRIGLIGVNGTGKSTLLKGIAGIEGFEAGTLQHSNQLRIEYLPQSPDLEESKAVIDEVYGGDAPVMQAMRNYERAQHKLEQSPSSEAAQNELLKAQAEMDAYEAWEAITTAKTVLTKLGVTDFIKPIQALSGGQKKRVAIAKALIQPADLLILDEPTNHLDQEAIEWLETYLAQYSGAIILVTHDRYVLNSVTNYIFELEQGNLYAYAGNYETFLQKRAEREAEQAKAEAKRQSLLKRELEWLQRMPKARGTKQKARKDRAEELKEEKGPKETENVDFAIGSKRLGKKVIEVEEAGKFFNDTWLFRNFTYKVTPKERIGIIGPNGAGKTTLMNVFAQVLPPDEGEVEHGETVRIGYYTQEQMDMDPDLRLIDYIREAAEVVYTKDGREITAEQMLERFLFSRASQWGYIRRLSGGEKRRLYLLRILMGEPNVLFLDEPTNDLDTETLSVLEDYLAQFPGVVVTVSHDRYFLDRVVDHLFVVDGSGKITRFNGGYSAYLQAQTKEATPTKKIKEEAAPTKQQKKMSYKEQQEYQTIEQQIEELEGKIEQLQTEIAEAGSDFETIQSLHEQQEQAEVELEAAMNRWAELAELAGDA